MKTPIEMLNAIIEMQEANYGDGMNTHIKLIGLVEEAKILFEKHKAEEEEKLRQQLQEAEQRELKASLEAQAALERVEKLEKAQEGAKDAKASETQEKEPKSERLPSSSSSLPKAGDVVISSEAYEAVISLCEKIVAKPFLLGQLPEAKTILENI